MRTETDRRVGTGAGMWGGTYVHLSPVTADILERVFCPFRLSRRSQRYSICLPSRPSDSPARAVSSSLCFPLSIVLPGLTNSPIACHTVSSGSTLLETGHDTPTAPPPHLSNRAEGKKNKKAHKWKHTCVQAQYGNTVCKFCFCMQMWNHAAQAQT